MALVLLFLPTRPARRGCPCAHDGDGDAKAQWDLPGPEWQQGWLSLSHAPGEEMKAGVRVLLLKDRVGVGVYFRKEKQTKNNKPGMKGVQGSGALGLRLLDSPAGSSLGPSSKVAWESKGHRR